MVLILILSNLHALGAEKARARALGAAADVDEAVLAIREADDHLADGI